jgi:hypothetical protein
MKNNLKKYIFSKICVLTLFSYKYGQNSKKYFKNTYLRTFENIQNQSKLWQSEHQMKTTLREGVYQSRKTLPNYQRLSWD